MEIKKRLIRTMLCAMALAATAQAQIHKTIVLRDGWTFSKDGGTFRGREKGSIVPNLRWRVPILMPNYSLTVQWQSRKFT